ncbi:MAG: hypothetical protein ACR2IV_05835 [Bryobacteraceae bacterium]
MPVKRLFVLCGLAVSTCLGQTTLTSTLTLTSTNNGQTFDNYRISTTSGPCVKMTGVSNVTISNSNIGPCGQDNSDADSNGIEIIDGTGNNIYDSYIHVENRALTNSFSSTASHAGVEGKATANLTIQGNVVCYGSANVRATDWGGIASTGWTVNGNYLCNPRGYDGSGNNFQAARSYGMTVTNNYAYSCVIGGSGNQIICPTSPAYLFTENQEDSINFYYASVPPSSAGTISGNYVVGGTSLSGTGIITDQYANGESIQSNTVVNAGQVGIMVADGVGVTVNANKVWMDNAYRSTNTGIAVDEQYGHTCSGDKITNNIARQIGGSNGSDIWIGTASCVSTSTGNVTGTAAETVLGLSGSATWAMIQTKLVPPLIPPVPKNCTVNSPYTTQTSLPRCGSAITAPPSISSFAASASSINLGQSSTLSWVASGATLLSINQGVGTVAGTNSKIVSPTTTTVYTLTATNSSGSISRSVTVTVVQPPTISSFTATPSTITAGGSSALSWTTTGAISLSIDQGIGTVTGLISTSVSPTTTTVYTLTASNTAGSAVATATVTASTASKVGASLILH